MTTAHPLATWLQLRGTSDTRRRRRTGGDRTASGSPRHGDTRSRRGGSLG